VESEIGVRRRKGAETRGKVMQFEQEGKEYRFSSSDLRQTEKNITFFTLQAGKSTRAKLNGV